MDSKTWYSPQQMLDMGIATAVAGRSTGDGAQQSVRDGIIRQLLAKPAVPGTPPAGPEKQPSLMQLFGKIMEKA